MSSPKKPKNSQFKAAFGDSSSTESQEGVTVARVASGDGRVHQNHVGRASAGKPRRVMAAAMKSRVGSLGGGLGGADSIEGAGGNFYSPELSTDFLELPQSLHEQWNYYRFFYRSEPFVGQAVDLHTELPISKVRIGVPKAKNEALARASTNFCIKWAKKVRLLDRLLAITHERNLIGEVFIWCEDVSPDMPEELAYEIQRVLTEGGEAVERKIKREDGDERAANWLKKNYRGWTSIRCLPPEQVRVRSFNFTNERILELVPDSETKKVISQATSGDPAAKRVVESMPPEVVKAVLEGKNIPLNTDPDAGSYCYYLANKKSDYEPRGHSILERCIRILVYRDKLRQAQTSIASRHMTPIRIVWGEDLNTNDVEALRDQIDMALQDPDYSIVANFEVRWEEMGAEQRLLDLGNEYDLSDRQLYAGLGVTEGLLSGEAAYSGDRINLEVINTRYMLLREQLQELVEDNFFRPMCARMGFVEEDEDGDLRVLVPTLSFTRLALRDNRDTFDALYNLYQKGSLDIDTILELLNLDPVMVREKIERDLFTVNDPTFNEVLRGIYGEVGRSLSDNSDVAEKIAASLGLNYVKPTEGGGRFAKIRTASGKEIPQGLAEIIAAVVETIKDQKELDLERDSSR